MSSKVFKLFVNVPRSHADAVRMALGKAGAGQLGEYHYCSFSVTGIGRFLPTDHAKPHLGKPGMFESVEEEQIQVLVSQERLDDVLAAMRTSHPYEQIGFDLFETVQAKLPPRKHQSA